MKNNKFFNYIKYPKKWLIILTFCLTFVFASLSIVLLIFDLAEKIYSYIVFGVAGICLTYAVFIIVIFAPNIKKWYVDTLLKFKFTKRMYEDYSFRTVVFACSALVINLLFGSFEIVMGAVGRSIWFGSLGLYHLILSFTRFGIILRYRRQSKRGEIDLKENLLTYRNTGICVLVFNLALAGAIGQMIFSRRAFVYAGLMIFAMAAFSFWKITVSIWGIIKAKKHNDYSTQSLRNLNLTDAMVTLYALQTALIATFSTAEGGDMTYMNMITGIVITIISLALGVYMIVKSSKERKKLKIEKGER